MLCACHLMSWVIMVWDIRMVRGGRYHNYGVGMLVLLSIAFVILGPVWLRWAHFAWRPFLV